MSKAGRISGKRCADVSPGAKREVGDIKTEQKMCGDTKPLQREYVHAVRITHRERA